MSQPIEPCRLSRCTKCGAPVHIMLAGARAILVKLDTGKPWDVLFDPAAGHVEHRCGDTKPSIKGPAPARRRERFRDRRKRR